MLEEDRKLLEKLDCKRCQILLKLPPELRHQVLSYLPKHDIVAVNLPGNHGLPPTKIPLPATAHAGDRLLRQETLIVTIESTTWSIHSWPGNQGFQAWLGGIDLTLASKTYATGFDAVKSLMFEFFSRYPHRIKQPQDPNNDIELMLKCGNLEHVTTEWAGEELREYDRVTGTWNYKTVDQLRVDYRLDRMLELRKLKKLELVLCKGVGLGVLPELGAWFVANMPQVAGKAIEVVVKQKYGYLA